MPENKKVDWAEGEWKEHLIEARKYLWREDSVEMFAKWLPLKQGMRMVDVGCGLGYNGWTYAKYFLSGGSYFGIDISEKLIKEALENSHNWSNGEKVDFQVGNVYDLPYENNFADITICQTLLMHLEHPEKALTEMKRVTKLGGLIVCVEPDNLSSSLRVGYSSLPEISIEERLLLHKVKLTVCEGKKKLGYGDSAIGIKIPKLMQDVGLEGIEMRNNDICHLIQYPYETEKQKQNLEMIKKQNEKTEKADYSNTKKMFLAGGGTEYMFRKYKKIVLNYSSKMKKIIKEQLESDSFFSCYGGSNFFIIRGKKS